jgi:hypothetical protein
LFPSLNTDTVFFRWSDMHQLPTYITIPSTHAALMAPPKPSSDRIQEKGGSSLSTDVVQSTQL